MLVLINEACICWFDCLSQRTFVLFYASHFFNGCFFLVFISTQKPVLNGVEDTLVNEQLFKSWSLSRCALEIAG